MRKRNNSQPSLIKQQMEAIREAMIDVTRRKDLVDIDNASENRLPEPDESELFASMVRLEEHGYLIAIKEQPQAYRIIETEAQRGIALAQGFSIWAPRDMFEYIHLPDNQREKLRRFKKVFVEASFDWGKYRG